MTSDGKTRHKNGVVRIRLINRKIETGQTSF